MKGTAFWKDGVDPGYTGSADSKGGQNGRSKGDAKTSQISGHYIVKHTENIGTENDHQAGITNVDDMWIAVKEGKQKLSASKDQQDSRYGYDSIFYEGQDQGAFATVDLLCAVVLAYKGGAGLTEGIKQVIYKDLNVVGSAGSSDHKGSKAVDRRLDHYVCNVKDSALDTGWKSDLQDFYETAPVDPKLAYMDLYPFVCMHQLYE